LCEENDVRTLTNLEFFSFEVDIVPP
jgi:hypothetical protein